MLLCLYFLLFLLPPKFVQLVRLQEVKVWAQKLFMSSRFGIIKSGWKALWADLRNRIRIRVFLVILGLDQVFLAAWIRSRIWFYSFFLMLWSFSYSDPVFDTLNPDQDPDYWNFFHIY